MLLKTIKGVDSLSSIICQKPISHLYIREILPVGGSDQESASVKIRVRLIDVRAGKTTEVLPNFDLRFISEIATKFEGHDLRTYLDADSNKFYGENTHRILLGAQLTDGRTAAVDLSNEKYFDLDLTGLNPLNTYEVYGVETHLVDSFVRLYSVFYMPKDEEQRSYKVGENELLVVPSMGLREIQFYAKNGRSFTVTQQEMIQDARSANDITRLSVKGVSGGIPVQLTGAKTGFANIFCGFENCFIFSIDEFESYDIRRSQVNNPLNFVSIDTRSTVSNQ